MRLLAILDKELQEVVKNKLLLLSVAALPLILSVLPIAMLLAAQADPLSPGELEAIYRLQPELRGLDPVSATQVLFVGQFVLLFLMIPAVVPLVIASFSVIGEKQARSLEPLLATPVHTWELLAGKCLGAVIPAMLATWLGYAIALAGVLVLGTELTVRAILGPTWVLSMFTLAPLLCVTAVSIGLIISSRVNDTRVAQQASIVLVLPLVAVFVGQFAGYVLVSVPLVLLGSLALLAVDAGLLYVAVWLFGREKILTEWR